MFLHCKGCAINDANNSTGCIQRAKYDVMGVGQTISKEGSFGRV